MAASKKPCAHSSSPGLITRTLLAAPRIVKRFVWSPQKENIGKAEFKQSKSEWLPLNRMNAKEQDLQNQQGKEENIRELFKKITKELRLQRKVVFDIAASVESTKTAINDVLHSLRVFISTTTIEQFSVRHNQLIGIAESVLTILEKFQGSILCQGENLKGAFIKLNSDILKTFDFVRPEDTQDDTCNICAQHVAIEKNMSTVYNSIHKEEVAQTEIEHNNINEDTDVMNNQMTQQQQGIKEDYENQQIKQIQQEMEHLKQHYIEKDQQITEMLKTIQQLNDENDQLKNENHQQSQKYTDLLNKHTESEEVISEKNEIIDNMQSERHERLSQLKENQIDVQIYFEGKGELILNVVDEFKSLLVQHMGIQRRELKFIHCPSVSDVDPDIPLMVLCIKISRIGTDVQRTLQHLNASKRAILLILHHKDVHALPSQASERVLTGVDFQTLGGIFDMAFLADKGLYPCDMNSKAVNGIVRVIKNGSV